MPLLLLLLLGSLLTTVHLHDGHAPEGCVTCAHVHAPGIEPAAGPAAPLPLLARTIGVPERSAAPAPRHARPRSERGPPRG